MSHVVTTRNSKEKELMRALTPPPRAQTLVENARAARDKKQDECAPLRKLINLAPLRTPSAAACFRLIARRH